MVAERKFTYDFKYDLDKEEYVYEYFAEIFKDQYGNEREECWLKKDIEKEEYQCAMFNNELNTSAQMIFTVHDVNLMDCKKMFRKEQIWFVHKDKRGVYVYSLTEFTAQQGVRSDSTDVVEKYKKGALPDPELINSLLSINGNEKGVNVCDK